MSQHGMCWAVICTCLVIFFFFIYLLYWNFYTNYHCYSLHPISSTSESLCFYFLCYNTSQFLWVTLLYPFWICCAVLPVRNGIEIFLKLIEAWNLSMLMFIYCWCCWVLSSVSYNLYFFYVLKLKIDYTIVDRNSLSYF